MKYTDKWAERSESGGGQSKWGDKWDEKFDIFSHGVKQGETWWEGASGGTAHGVRNILGLVGCTSMGKVAVVNIGIHMNSRKHGMKDTLTMGFIIV